MNEPLSNAQRALIAQMLRGEAATKPPARIPRRASGSTFPLSAAQRQIWLDAALAADAPIYNESITIHRFGSFDLAALQASLNALLLRHEAWRTSFVSDGAEPTQIIHPSVTVPLAMEDVSHLPTGQRDAAAIAIATADAIRPIDMTAPPLIRARVVRIAEEEHRLYLTLHHIIFDGVAIYRVILPELAQLYAAFSTGRLTPLPEPEIGYGDYVVWHEQHVASAEVQRQLAHWKVALADAPPRFDLVGDRPRPAAPTRAGSMETFALSRDLTDRLHGLARDRGATLYMVLLAGFTALLHRYGGEEDIVIGGVTDLRRRPELRDVVGYFLNTFALRSKATPDLPFDTHLAAVRTMVAGALDASEVPFDEVLQAQRVRRSGSGHPLFSILFSIEPPAEPAPDGWDLTQMDVIVGGAKFDLYLELDERPDGMAARFLYDTELFDRDTIRRMIGHWLTLLESITADAATPIGKLPLLTKSEATQLAAWNATGRPAPAQTVADMIGAQARRTPEAAAIIGGGLVWSYRTLDAKADRIAARLRGAGYGAGSLIAVALDRTPELVATLIGIWRAGAAYLPLDAAQPDERLRWIVGDAKPDLLYTQKRLADSLPTGVLPVMFADDGDTHGAAASGPIKPTDLAYVLYTSGSTGVPKGVEIDHAALANFLETMRDRPGFGAKDALLAVTTLTFDIAALELFLPLVSGGKLVIAPTATAHDPVRLMALMAEARPTVMQATPATWLSLLEAGWDGEAGLKILCGGEAMSDALAKRLLDRCASLWNMYGPTEATIWATVQRIERGCGPIAIGRPIANMTADILDQGLRPVPAGVVGELYLGGIGLARGYRGQASLTRERFPTIGGNRLYRTGDLARRQSDGSLVWLGRADNEEKIRGYRVAVEEVEGVLASYAGVAGAAVRGVPDASGMRTLVAYIVAAEGAAPDLRALRIRLATALPDYMVPGRWILIDALPLTPSGKVDRKALPAPPAHEATGIVRPPAGKAEERLALLWRDVLRIETFDRTDSFFDLGGHSLLAARLMRRIECEYGRKMDMAALFRAHHFDRMVAALAAPPLEPGLVVPIQPLGNRPPLFWLSGGPSQLPLANQLGTERPFLGIPLSAMAEANPGWSFIDHAREVVRRVRVVQPNGPYLIGGWCTAGILAFEVARQLRDAGADVPLLIIGDSVDPSRSSDPWRRVRYHLKRLVTGPQEGRLLYLKALVRKELARWGFVAPLPVPSKDDAGAALDNAARRYRPEDYAGDVLFFRSSDWDARLGMGGWQRHMRGRIMDHVFPGDHESFFRPGNVDPLAALLRIMLAKRAG